MARARLSGRRRSGRRRRTRARRRRRSARIGGAELLLVVLLVVLGFLALRSSRGGGDGGTGTPGTGDDPGAGGGRPAAELLATLTVAPEASRPGYERERFGDGWMTGPNGCDTRDQVLAEESRVPVVRGDDGCSVARGEWASLYDGYSTDDPAELEVDHMVPLAEAWGSGAADWSPQRRERYANDTRRTDALVAVTAATNQSKSDQDPAEWMPPRRESWCRYVDAWITQKAAWRLTIDAAERRALGNILRTC